MARPKQTTVKKIVPVRMSAEDKQKIMSMADQAGLTTSEFIRRSALGKRIHSKVHLKAMGELSRLGGLQKLCITKAPEFRPQLNEVIREIVTALKLLHQGGR
jgi:hypothetical protein